MIFVAQNCADVFQVVAFHRMPILFGPIQKSSNCQVLIILYLELSVEFHTGHEIAIS